MKKILFVAAILVCSMAAESRAKAQTTKSVSYLSNAKSLEKALSLFDPFGSINTKAVRDFKKNYPNADGEQWYSFKDGFAVKFKEDGLQHMSTYSRVGNWLYTIIYYEEKKLPENVRAMVKSIYYDYSITMVEEINLHDDQTIYLVHMQDENTWKILKIADREMSIVEDFNKK